MKLQVKMSDVNDLFDTDSEAEAFALTQLLSAASYLYDTNKEAYSGMITPGEGIQSRQVVAILHAIVKLGLVEV